MKFVRQIESDGKLRRASRELYGTAGTVRQIAVESAGTRGRKALARRETNDRRGVDLEPATYDKVTRADALYKSCERIIHSYIEMLCAFKLTLRKSVMEFQQFSITCIKIN